MGFLDRGAFKGGAAELRRIVKEGAEDYQTKRELATAFDELGEKVYELSKAGDVFHPEVERLVAKIDALDTKLEESLEEDTAFVEGRFGSLRAMFRSHDDTSLSVEGFLVRLVEAVRDEEAHDQTSRDVYVAARKRRRRLGLAALGAGPFVGVANQIADLYCETAVVCELAALHKLDLSEEEIAAHMLVLWSITDDLAQAWNAMRGDPPVAKILAGKLLDTGRERVQVDGTKRSIVKALWDIRGIVADGTVQSSDGSLRTVLFTGHRTKKLIRRAQRQLGVS